ncbi:hypothetical protein FHR83_009140 [Actinoplanes campanulatus]|uniref:ABC3 transporter permease C-terminal domain-containing protein n=1 Tax=Actinoplanes campanulatus TaxID=113559 RepID=A0A7W5FK80_9ACTN|nr:ABC transporter permease [Actinoplanes campanulatus]MBB3101411.1 hypothetical protein [Actinoplanes campanulatus]
MRLQPAEQFASQDYDTDAKLTDSLAMMLGGCGCGCGCGCGRAVANSMAMAGYGRRIGFTVLRSAGGTRWQLLGVAIGETGLLMMIGSVWGLVATLPPLAGAASASARNQLPGRAQVLPSAVSVIACEGLVGTPQNGGCRVGSARLYWPGASGPSGRRRPTR